MSFVQWPSHRGNSHYADKSQPWSKWSKCMSPLCNQKCYTSTCQSCQDQFIAMAKAKRAEDKKAEGAKSKAQGAGPPKPIAGDASLWNKVPSKAQGGPPPKAGYQSALPPAATKISSPVADQSSNAVDAAEDSSPEQKAIVAVKQSI